MPFAISVSSLQRGLLYGSITTHAQKHPRYKLELFPGVCIFLQCLFAEKIVFSCPFIEPLFCIQTGFLSGLIMEETFIETVQLLIKPPRKSLEEGEKLFRTRYKPENTTDISRLHHCFPVKWRLRTAVRKEDINSILMTSTTRIWVVLLIGWSKSSTNQKHYLDLGSDASSVWNFCTCFSDVISQNLAKCWLFLEARQDTSLRLLLCKGS